MSTMRHPLRRVATQGAWYALGNGLVKLSGLILLPILTNTRFLPMADYGHWGVYEVSVQLAVSLLGLSLAVGLVRFYNEPEGGGAPVLSSAWWITVLIGAGTALLAGSLITTFAPAGQRAVLGWLTAYTVLELLLAIPLALFRAREQAGRHTWLQALKLGLLVALGLLFVAVWRLGLLGLVKAFAIASGVTLLTSLFAARRREFLVFGIPRETARRILVFSVPLVIGGLGSMVLNAGDRYVLAAFRPAEQVALYTLAGKFGGVVNMFVVQPLNLAWLPLLFRMEERQRPEVLRLMVPYLTFALCFVVVALSVLAAPALRIMGSTASYRQAVPLLPWIGFGFASYGLATVFGGIMALFQRTRALSMWLIVGAAVNIGLNFTMIPSLGALGAAINTLVAYAVLFLGQYATAQKLLRVRYPWGRLLGVAAVSFAAAFAGALRQSSGSALDWALRLAILAGWLLVLFLTRWFSVHELRDVWRVMRNRRRGDVR